MMTPERLAEIRRSFGHGDTVITELLAEIERLRVALLTARGYAVEIEADAGTSLQSLRASLIQEGVDRALGLYPPAEAPTYGPTCSPEKD